MLIKQPYIISETDDYAVVFKPPKMHSTGNEPGTLINRFIKKVEASDSLTDNGLIHRLDYETHGLVLFAKNKTGYNFFKDLQNRGEFVKEYSAVCLSSVTNYVKDGFPPPPNLDLNAVPKTIMSYFRPYGPGRKQVRPVTEENKFHETAKDNGGFYRTEIIDFLENEKGSTFTVRIKRGFRHQIRCHLSWIKRPILNDPLYNLNSEDNESPGFKYLTLRAHALFFSDPSTGEKRECRIDQIMI